MNEPWPYVRRLAVAALGALVVVAAGTPSAAAGAPRSTKRLLGYYTSWSKTATPAYSAREIPYRKLTHIVHAFLLVDEAGDGRLRVSPDLLEPELIRRAHAAGVKVLISIGGAGDGQLRAFTAVAHSEAARGAFARNVREFVVANGYDGVDIDYEVPTAPDDTEPCTLLVRAVRDELPSPQFLLSMAIPSNPPSWGTGFDVPALAPMLDFINVMTYDMHGPWTDHAGHHSPLQSNPNDPGHEGSIADSIDLFVNTFGVPPAKLNAGTGFYGYGFDGAANLWDSCRCASSTTSLQYATGVKPRITTRGWAAKVDPVAKAPYLVRTDGGRGFVTYDDAKSTARKVDYALRERGLGGVFMWELSGDYDGRSQELLSAMARTIRKLGFSK